MYSKGITKVPILQKSITKYNYGSCLMTIIFNKIYSQNNLVNKVKLTFVTRAYTSTTISSKDFNLNKSSITYMGNTLHKPQANIPFDVLFPLFTTTIITIKENHNTLVRSHYILPLVQENMYTRVRYVDNKNIIQNYNV